MGYRFFVLVFCVIFFVSLGMAYANQFPNITIPIDVWNFGEVKSGEVVEYDFVILNSGEAELVIDSVTPTCSCTKAKIDVNKIKPGKEAKLKVVLDTAGKSGEYVSLIMIASNDPDEPVKRIKVKVRIRKKE